MDRHSRILERSNASPLSQSSPFQMPVAAPYQERDWEIRDMPGFVAPRGNGSDREYGSRYETVQTRTVVREHRGSLSEDLKRPPALPRERSAVYTIHNVSVQYREAQTNWIVDSKARTEEFQRNGSRGPTAWVFCEDGKVPLNAIQGGEENGEAWYVARAFYEGSVYLAKAGRRYPYGALIDSVGGDVTVEKYEVLVSAVPLIKWFDASSVVGTESRLDLRMIERERLLTLEALFARISRLDAVKETIRTETVIAQPVRRTYTIAEERELTALKKYDTIIIVDDSASMRKSWFQTRHALSGIAEKAAEYDTDGVDVCFLNSQVKGLGLKSPAQVMQLFADVQPSGVTYLAGKLDSIINDYISALEHTTEEVKPINIIALTDGRYTDDLREVIVKAVHRLRDLKFSEGSLLGIQLVQIGDDAEASREFTILDNELVLRGLPDIVDTVRISNESQLTTAVLTKILLGGIDRRQDLKRD